MNDMTKTVREFYKAVEGAAEQQKKGGYDTQATVRRIEDGIAWVHIPDGVDETPAKMTISAKEGDVVQVRIVNGRAFLVGNASAPPTDNTEAVKALTQADVATRAAGIAQQMADEAVEDAATAHEAAMSAQDAADAAQDSADAAQTSADNAQASATTANQAANSALAGLGTVESVLDVVTWFSEHKTATTDTTVQAGKAYYEYDASTGVLIKVDPEGTENPSEEGWYELDEAITNYVSTHLAQTNNGLNVVSSINGWRVLISSGGGNYNAGVYLIDPSGNIAQSTTAAGVVFNTGKPVNIGDSTAYINFDGNGHITVVGADFTIGGANNVSGTLTVKDASGNTIGTWDKDGMYVTSLLNITSSDRTKSISLKYEYAGITKKTLTVDPTTNSQTQNSNLTYETLFTTDDLITGKLYSTGLFYSKVGAYIEGTTDLELLNCPQINTLTLYTFSLVAYGLLDSANIRATNTLTVQKATTGSNAYDSVNPRLDFKNADASQNIALIFTDYDSVQQPASLTLAGNQGGEFFIAPNIKASNGSRSVTLKTDGTRAGIYDENQNNYLVFTNAGDTWMYLNRGDIYSSGIYCGTKVLRTDGSITVGTSSSYPFTVIYKTGVEVHTASGAMAYVGAYSGASANCIYMQCETDGRVTLGSRGNNGTWYTILNRANNDAIIHAYLNWNFDGSIWVGDTSDSDDRFCKVRNSRHVGSLYSNYSSNLFGVHSETKNKWLIYINSSGTVVANTSDIRYKENISNMPESDALSILREVDIINFSYKEDEQHTMQSGVSAQQLRDVVLKHGIKEHAYLTMGSAIEGDTNVYTDLTMPEEKVRYEVDYSKFVPILWKGWQYQDKRIRELEAEIDRLRERMKAS